MTAIQAIKAYCLGCMCGSKSEVTLCPVTDCELYPFRLGRNPNYKGRQLTDEEREKRAEQMREMQRKKREAEEQSTTES